ncbi:PhoX family protein [Arthrobacter agilis]|uniref:PhoX family protein n=1 Tax=Arthrobacter agilis TaxID=37921 RepID=UPI000B35D53F|nr:PhoX family phosphatase [Arthrobacter agilis]OUM42942.1 phosphatase [Arthrobacter agilis]PPB45888.1 PhoX family protein [Arthrobacter agilis]TPV25430.1 PhoX family protein [Arthrobacter agilis]VDR33168.1 Predicted phosphatase [Arthrobacter agilis]
MTDITRRLLPMLGHTKGKRSAVTCALKCDNACSAAVCNTSKNDYFRDIVSSEFSRRSALGAGAAGALTLFIGTHAGAGAAVAAPGQKPGKPAGALAFTAIEPVDALVDDMTVPQGYGWKPVIRWGDPLFTSSPAFDADNQTAAAQALQFGYNCDYTDIIEIEGSKGRRAVLFANHEYTNENIMVPPTLPAAEVRGIGKAAHGLSVVELERKNANKPWSYVQGAPLNRRYLTTTPYEVTGPAAGSDLLRTKDDPTGRTILGTLGNCAGGTTPWGTILSGEENFNGYFVSPGTSAGDRRYGISSRPTARGWEIDEPRWDTRNPGYENETNRFGYIVEVDPFDPTSTPKKHSALGRFKHEGANVTVAADGRVVAYMGDDERFDYLYKFVSTRRVTPGASPAARRANMTLLSEGSLYVARLQGNSVAEIDGSGSLPSDGAFDGVGEWLPLLIDNRSVVPGMTAAEVSVFTRLAADTVGPTKMDRCEDVEPNPVSGKVYIACTNNTNRGIGSNAVADEANPRTQNRDGHVVEITEAGGNASGTRFTWTLLLVCGDPARNPATYFSGYPKDRVSPISCPDNVAFDSEGNLWISTDGQPGTVGFNDGLFKVGLEGAERGRVQQFLAVPRDAETCGPIIRDQDGSVFVAVQHPGEDGSWGQQASLFPDYVPLGGRPGKGEAAIPRPSVIQVYRGTGSSAEDHRGRGRRSPGKPRPTSGVSSARESRDGK